MLARRECVEELTRKGVHGVPCAAHRKLGFVGLAMVGKTVLAIVRQCQSQRCPMLNLSFDRDLTRQRMGTSMFLLMLVARPKTKMTLGRQEVEYGLYFS
jgi:hypothetical protein